jgi:hypothetical protein
MEGPSCDRGKESLLQLTGGDVLLVRCVFDAWGALSLIGIYWRSLHGLSATTILFAMGIGCVANWVRNRTLHCAFTAPIFLIAAVVFLLSEVDVVHVNAILIWPFVLIGVGAAFLLEWRYERRKAVG